MKKLYIMLGIISLVIIFLFLPIGIDKIFMNRFVTNWDMGQWAGFLGSYLGGGIGGIITLVGVWWQMTNEKKTKEKENKLGFLRHIEHILTRNLSAEDNKEINQETNNNFAKNTYQIFSYSSLSLIGEEPTKLLIEFNSNIINENLNYIYTLSFGKKLYELNEKIIEFNSLYDFLFRNLSSKKELLMDITKFLSNESKHPNSVIILQYIDFLEILSNLIYNLIIYNQENINLNIKKLTDLSNSLQVDDNILLENNFKNTPPNLLKYLKSLILKINGEDVDYKSSNYIKLVIQVFLDTTNTIQSNLSFYSELARKLFNYRKKEDRLYQLDIFKIFEEMEEILTDVRKEINRIGN